MSHDYQTDKLNLLKVKKHNLQYIGILGPKKGSTQLIQELQSEHHTIATDNIYAPLGLDTGATTQEEIAISIIAEIRSVYSKYFGGNLRKRKGSIHDS